MNQKVEMQIIEIQQRADLLFLCPQVASVVVSMNETGAERSRLLLKGRVPDVEFKINQ